MHEQTEMKILRLDHLKKIKLHRREILSNSKVIIIFIKDKELLAI